MKPRTKNAVLLSVGVLEYLTLQILNGTIKFSVDNGAGVESVTYSPPANNIICDGHWHQIKVSSNFSASKIDLALQEKEPDDT